MENLATHIQLEYLPTPQSRTWRKAFTMWAAGRENMERDANRLKAEEGWYAWRIVPHQPESRWS